MKRTNIMLTDDQHTILKAYAKEAGKTLGELVREALDAIYKKKDKIEYTREVGLAAYREGFISVCKFKAISERTRYYS